MKRSTLVGIVAGCLFGLAAGSLVLFRLKGISPVDLGRKLTSKSPLSIVREYLQQNHSYPETIEEIATHEGTFTCCVPTSEPFHEEWASFDPKTMEGKPYLWLKMRHGGPDRRRVEAMYFVLTQNEVIGVFSQIGSCDNPKEERTLTTNEQLIQEYKNHPATQAIEKAMKKFEDDQKRGVHPDDAPKQFGDSKKQNRK
jgi:hypothetical protein